MGTARERSIARNLAAALLAGTWTEPAMTRRVQTLLGRATRKSQKRLVAEVIVKVTTAYPPSVGDLADLIRRAPSFERAARALMRNDKPLRMVLRSPRFAPVAALRA